MALKTYNEALYLFTNQTLEEIDIYKRKYSNNVGYLVKIRSIINNIGIIQKIMNDNE